MAQSILITGTTSGVGKTVVMLAIAAYYQTFCADRSLALYKPVSNGLDDPKQYQTVLNVSQPLDDMTTVSTEGTSESSRVMDARIDLAAIWKQVQSLSVSHDLVLMEALGGLGTPLTPETTVADLAWDWRLPTFLVVPVQPGAIGQAIAHVALARQFRVHLKGIILSCPTPMAQADMAMVVDADLLQSLTQIPVLGYVPYINNVGDRTKLAHVASNLDIARIFPSL